MDVWVCAVDGHWTLYSIYLPVFVLFVPVLWGWARLSPAGLLGAAAVNLALVGYGLYPAVCGLGRQQLPGARALKAG